jgi:hypothetical protein
VCIEIQKVGNALCEKESSLVSFAPLHKCFSSFFYGKLLERGRGREVERESFYYGGRDRRFTWEKVCVLGEKEKMQYNAVLIGIFCFNSGMLLL